MIDFVLGPLSTICCSKLVCSVKIDINTSLPILKQIAVTFLFRKKLHMTNVSFSENNVTLCCPKFVLKVQVFHKDIFACLFSIHNTISLSCHEQVCLSGLHEQVCLSGLQPDKVVNVSFRIMIQKYFTKYMTPIHKKSNATTQKYFRNCSAKLRCHRRLLGIPYVPVDLIDPPNQASK